MKIALLLLSCLLLTGCGDRLLERSYSTVTPHNALYRETEDTEAPHAENRQDIVNTLLVMLGEHREGGVVHIYGDAGNKAAMARAACAEARENTALGAYLLNDAACDGVTENGYYRMNVRFDYRRTAEEQAAIGNATSTEVMTDLLRVAAETGEDTLAVRVGWPGADRAGIAALVSTVYDGLYPSETPEAPSWTVRFYPDNEQPGIVEILLNGSLEA